MRSRSLEDVPFPTLDWRCREPTTSPKRKASPMRRLVHELENGSPKIVFNRSGGLPLHVKEIKQRFYKATREGYIPRSLRAVVENKAGEEVDEISEEAYGEYDIVGVHSMWFAVLEVYQSAQDCDRFTQDESAWCDDVVRPALQWEGAFPNFYKVLNL